VFGTFVSALFGLFFLLLGEIVLNPVLFLGTEFMRSTSAAREQFKLLLFVMTGVAICQFPVITQAAEWYITFAQDHDALFLLQGVTEGFSYQFEDPDPLGEFYSVANYVPTEHSDKVDAWVKAETVAGRYIPVDRDSTLDPRGTAAIGVVDKDHSDFVKVRVVHDLSRPEDLSTNDGIDIPHSLFPTVGDAFALLQPGWYQAKVDLTSAYRSVPVHSTHWRYQCGEWAGVMFADCALSFGLRAAPSIFDRITQAIVRALKAMGIRAVLGYIDDFWVCAPTEEECRRAYECVIALLTRLGFVVNRGKCVPPTTCIIFLGFELDSDAQGVCRMTVPSAKRARGIVLCEEFLSLVSQSGGRCIGYTSSRYESLVGFLAHCASVVFGGRLYLTHLYHAWRFAKRYAFSPSAVSASGMRSEVSWWLRLFKSDSVLAERSLHQRARVSYDFFATDASTIWGMGGFFGGKFFSKSWAALALIKQPAGYFPDLTDETGTGHINYLELFAVYWALAMWGKHMAGRIIVLHVDSMVALHCLRKLATSSLIFVPLLQAITELLLRYDLRLHLTYISSAANVLADLLSRGAEESAEFKSRVNRWLVDRPRLGHDFEDWMLHTHIYEHIIKPFGAVAVTACADAFGRNSHTERYWSAVDCCMQHSWCGILVWANPPFSLIAAILRHFLRCKMAQPIGTALLLLVPVWDKEWYRVITSMPRTFRRIHYFGPHSDLFTAPPFPSMAPEGRRLCGTTNWPVEVYYVGTHPMVESPPADFMSGNPFRR
jgi:hypothetical protein